MNRKVLAGCGCLVLLVIGAIAVGVFVVGPRAVQKGRGWISAQIDEVKNRAALEAAWQPPSLRPDASWFPAAVDTWQLGTSEDITTVPELQLDRPGRRGKYRGEKQDIDVLVVPVSDLELGGVFDRAQSATRTGSSHVTTRTPGRLYLRVNGTDHTRLWWIKDWLFIFRTTGPDDPDAFAEKYLGAMKPGELEKQ